MNEFTINCKGDLVDLSTPKVMGILNLTPDSFYDGGKYKTDRAILTQAEKMLAESADFIDLGAYSSRPGAAYVSVVEEKKRLLPILNILLKEFPNLCLSVDTFRAEVARAAVENGAVIINDISGGHLDRDMLQTVGRLKVPYIMMHMRGTPDTMQRFTNYEDLIVEMRCYFAEQIATAREHGIQDIIVDPGFGFSKTRVQNFELMKKLELFHVFDLPLLVGVSRKSMVYKTLNIEPEDALNGTTVLHTVALQKGTHILRVHDVKEAIETIKIMKALL